MYGEISQSERYDVTAQFQRAADREKLLLNSFLLSKHVQVTSQNGEPFERLNSM